ncbi:VanW family protein [Candidatus Roizmanbacteria bacterium]|mgnify:CR=1 FL=1|nr:VanW family protein [Candidatus Roizmanbacteria bacterium]
MISNIRNYRGNSLLLLVVVLGLILFGSTILFFLKQEKNIRSKIYPNVFLDKQNFGLKSKEEIVNYYEKKSSKLKNTSLTVFYEKEPVATFSAQILDLRYDGKTIAERAYLIGRSSNTPSKYLQKILAILNLRKFYFESQIQYDNSEIKDFLSTSEDRYNLPAKNALFKFEKGKVVEFRKESNGLKILTDRFLPDFDKAVNDLKTDTANKKIILNSEIIKPEIKLSDINEYGIEELIAEGKSDYTHSIPQRVHNLTLAASKFNGVLIPKGKEFSFVETVGDISSLTGYQPAYIIKDGKTVLGDGGGVCQVSTTLFRAALNAGLPIIERTAHAYRVLYYENDSQPGFDATVYAPTVDIKIKNDTPSYILIETEIDKENNLLYFRFYGKKDNRRIEISKATVYDISPALPTKYQDDPTLKKGVTKQVDFAAGGAKTFFSYKVFQGDKTTIDTKFYSNFRPWAAVYLVGTAD